MYDKEKYFYSDNGRLYPKSVLEKAIKDYYETHKDEIDKQVKEYQSHPNTSFSIRGESK